MALEIKGLRANALSAAGHIERIRKAYARLNEIAPAHAADVEGLADQVHSVADDIGFAATVLGNSSGESEKPAEPPKPSPATQPAATHFNPPAAIYESPRAIPRITLSSDDTAKISPQEVGQAAAVTFQPADPMQTR